MWASQPSDPDPKITQASEVQGACTESKILDSFWFKSYTAVLTFSFHFLSFPLLSFFFFFCLIFFSFAEHVVGFISVGKGFS